MYQKHFGLTERPFSIAPDPRFLYMSQQHREALAHLLYGIGEGGGFVQLTGEVGTGKTTICRCLLEQLPEQVDLALILNPRVNAQELLASLCDELHISYPPDTTSVKVFTDVLSAYLLDSHARGRRTVLMIDEAQNLSAEALEQVRLLTNLETNREKLLQIILVGQPELRSLLGRVELRQLSQRITARFHLEPITRRETAAYIRHRLQVCGAAETIFNERAMDQVHRLSAGVPRLINVLCDRAMLGAFVEGKLAVDEPIVRKAAREVLPEEDRGAPGGHAWRWVAAVAVLAVLGGTAYQLGDRSAGWSMLLGAVQAPVIAPDTPVPATVPAPSGEPESSSEVASAALSHESAVAAALPDAKSSPENTPDKLPSSEPVAPAAGELAQALAVAGPRATPNAWAGLYRLWGIKAEVMGDAQACAQAPGVGLRCLQGSGSWAMVSQLDRPAILLLVGDSGRRVPVLLHESLGSTVRVQIDSHELEVSVGELTREWLGQYQLLWKTPPNGSAVLRPGDRGSDVAWLRGQMQEATGLTSIAPDPSFFDEGLKQLVQEFQREQGLQDDGVAGPRTLIYLNNQERPATGPRLGVVSDQVT